MKFRDLLKIQNDISRKEANIETLLLILRYSNNTMHEKTALKKAIQELEKSVRQLNTALNNNL